MWNQLFERLGHRYIAAMLLATRLCGSIGGVLVVYYVNLTLTLPDPTRTRFVTSCAVVVVLAVILSLLMARWETRHLCTVLTQLFDGKTPDHETAVKAGREAVVFPVRHHRNEAWLVPATTLVPVLILLAYWDDASIETLNNVAIAVFMGIGLALMSTFFIIERLMQPVVHYLLDHDVPIDFDRLPSNRLRARLNLCFGLIILITALMIGTLARQRAADIIQQPNNQNEAVANLRTHTTYITLTAIIVGLSFSTAISQSVASRVARLVQAMMRVERGSFSEELRATGNDEIDVLTRQFNSMVQRLAQHDATIRDLNVNLERKVEERTLSLRLLHAELDQRNNELETALTDVKQMQSQLVEVAHRAGMTEIAAGVLHNVGNVLNSVNVSVSVINDNVRKSKVTSVARAAALMKEHSAAFSAGGDPKILRLPEYLGLLADSLAEEQRQVESELGNLLEKVQHIKNIINAQQNYTRRVCFRESIDVHSLIEDLLNMHQAAIVQNAVTVERDFVPLPKITIEKSKLLQVLDNLIKNALESIAATPRASHVLRITSKSAAGELSLSVADSGHGITEDRLKCIFRFGFTTKTNGNGFGLHSAAIAMNEMGGSIRVHSAGADQGATFTITLPMKAAPESESHALPVLDTSHIASANSMNEFA
ncbi:MAG TPA: ATP-binding protein [Pirellulales bacterium]|nr:ATP-binding protein [Pirellulales bacterium]